MNRSDGSNSASTTRTLPSRIFASSGSSPVTPSPFPCPSSIVEGIALKSAGRRFLLTILSFLWSGRHSVSLLLFYPPVRKQASLSSLAPAHSISHLFKRHSFTCSWIKNSSKEFPAIFVNDRLHSPRKSLLFTAHNKKRSTGRETLVKRLHDLSIRF